MMRYHDGSTVTFGDIVAVPVPGGTARARVVMLGETYEHLEVDAPFLAWVEKDRALESSALVAEQLDANPFAHDDPRYAPIGNFTFRMLDEDVEPER